MTRTLMVKGVCLQKHDNALFGEGVINRIKKHYMISEQLLK